MKINQENVMRVTFWLLQCDPSDFDGPLEPIAEWFEALGDAYLYHENNSASSDALACAEKIQSVLLARLLFRHLNPSAKIHVTKMLLCHDKLPSLENCTKQTGGRFLGQWLQKIKRKTLLPFPFIKSTH